MSSKVKVNFQLDESTLLRSFRESIAKLNQAAAKSKKSGKSKKTGK
jgi:hypothetical protein